MEGFFLTHYDFLAKPEDQPSLPPGPTGLQPLPDMLARLSRAPVVSIASIRGRATGVVDSFVEHLALRIASFDKMAIAETKRLVDIASLPTDAEIVPEWDAFIASVARPTSQTRLKALMERGFHSPGDVEARLGYYVGQLGATIDQDTL